MINQHYFRSNTGLVLWVVPSEAIYTQTLKSFNNLDHPYRAVLDQASPHRRANVFEAKKHTKTITHDIATTGFSVMMMMQQGAGRQNRESLRMFSNSGSYMTFFPDTNDIEKHERFLKEIPNLDYNKGYGSSRNIKYSLGNVLKTLQPIIIIDEGHTASGRIRYETLNQFNPRFILELSATPQEKSNLLVNVLGRELKEEQMIKLPIQLENVGGGEWKTTLSSSCERLKELGKKAVKNQQEGGKYIRPILLVRVENTGNDQRGKGTIHSEDVRDYLTTELGFNENEVRVKTSDKNEIADDDLMSPACPVRFIITKQALQEGWDCPFAYVLALLDKGTSTKALTQMIGRVLRQPYAETTGVEDLDNAHIFCFSRDVSQAVKDIQASLNHHGLGDLKMSVIDNEELRVSKSEVPRRKEFAELECVMPKVIHKDGESTRPLDYERDILEHINWDKISNDKQGLLIEVNQSVTTVLIDEDSNKTETRREVLAGEAGESFFARQIADIVPNPWQAMRIVKDAMPTLSNQRTPTDIYNNRMNFVKEMRCDLERQKESASQKLFKKKIDKKEIVFSLDATNSNWTLPQSIRLRSVGTPKYLTRETNSQLALSLYEKYEERDFNNFEKEVACYLDEAEAIKWWHRVAARQEDGLQGWRKHIVYPDFVAFIDNKTQEHFILETKGDHLARSLDTNYKEDLFNILQNSCEDVGDVKMDGVKSAIALKVVNQTNWKGVLYESGISPKR